MSVPPTPGSAAIKRPDTNKVATLPAVFREHGYDTAFLCGGYSYFDNFKDFFAANQCRVVDRSDLAPEEVTFSTVWGVCDEDLLGRVTKEADAAHDRGTPFFYLALTVSNHRPYTYPQVIDIPSGTGRAGSVKYTDYAIGEFIEACKKKPWFDNTVFVIVADHCGSSAGKTDLPVDRYHIPLLIYAPKIVAPARYDGLCSQIDVGPTLLGLLNFSYTSKFFGQDLFRSKPNRAFVATYQKLGLLADRTLTVLDVGRECKTYRVGPDDSETLAPLDESLVFDTVSYYQSASYLLKHHLY